MAFCDISNANKALSKNLRLIQSDVLPEFRVSLVNDNLLNWRVSVVGPNDTLYEGGCFILEMNFPSKFPFQPPRVRMLTPMFHPNISAEDGQICMDILLRDWCPALTVEKIILSIISILHDPLMDGTPSNVSAAELYRSDRTNYNSIVRQHVLLYAQKHDDLSSRQ